MQYRRTYKPTSIMRNNLRIENPLTLEELQAKVPSAFATEAHPKMSERYSFVPTIQVVQDMLSLGWQIGNAFEVNARKGIGYQKHCVEFFKTDVTIERDGELLYPTVILKNSHNGLSGFEFRIGIYRLVCSNGLVIADSEFGKLAIKHIGYNFGELAGTMLEFVAKVDEMTQKVEKLMATELPYEKVVEFAEKAVEIRNLGNKAISMDSMLELLEPHRKGDMGNSLWRVMNRVQENLLAGNFSTPNAEGKERKARPIKNFELDLDYNTKLWELASEYAM